MVYAFPPPVNNAMTATMQARVQPECAAAADTVLYGRAADDRPPAIPAAPAGRWSRISRGAKTNLFLWQKKSTNSARKKIPTNIYVGKMRKNAKSTNIYHLLLLQSVLSALAVTPRPRSSTPPACGASFRPLYDWPDC